MVTTPPRPRGRHAGPPREPNGDPAGGYPLRDPYGQQPAPPPGYERPPGYGQQPAQPPRPRESPEARRPSEPHFTQSIPSAGYERPPAFGQQPLPRPQPAFYPRESEPARAVSQTPKASARSKKKPTVKKKQNPLAGCLLLLGVAAVIVVVVVVLTHHSGPSASFRARVQDYTVIDPADLAVTIRVTNTGAAAGTPDCTVQASDPSGADSGVNEGTMASPVKPGQTVTSVMQVTITHQGAQYVSQASVSCTG